MVKSRIDGGWKKRQQHTSLLFSLKSEKTANQLHISLEPDHDPNPTGPERNGTRHTHTVAL